MACLVDHVFQTLRLLIEVFDVPKLSTSWSNEHDVRDLSEIIEDCLVLRHLLIRPLTASLRAVRRCSRRGMRHRRHELVQVEVNDDQAGVIFEHVRLVPDGLHDYLMELDKCCSARDVDRYLVELGVILQQRLHDLLDDSGIRNVAG